MALIFDLSKGENPQAYNEPTEKEEAIRLYLLLKPRTVIPKDIEGNNLPTIQKGSIDVLTATATDFSNWLDNTTQKDYAKSEPNRNFVRRCFWIRFQTEAETYRTSKVSANLMNEWSLIKSRKPYLMTPKEQESFLGETGGINPKGHIRLDGSI